MNPTDAIDVAKEIGKIILLMPLLWAMVKRLEKSFEKLASEVGDMKLAIARDETPHKVRALEEKFGELKAESRDEAKETAIKLADHEKQLMRVWAIVGNRPGDTHRAINGD